ncbi:peptide MFS transporter [Gaopeijia maritima]|uniref:peptide MFS transporter n=1 Tax=Gaopeijia maritima TaxID=3119007 RepID=UPI00327300FD
MTSHTTAAQGPTFFGHPRGLATLFFTEMWERFSYYGMRALLILFMTAATVGDNPGLGLDVGTATAIYGLYTSLVYLLALPGGWIADNLWGKRKSVYVGGWIIAAGHFSMAVPSMFTFFLGLVLIVMGTGLLKPNVSAIVGDLYPEGGARRDAGFSIFYMGINVGALLGPILCGALGEGFSVGSMEWSGMWHLGFSLAGVGMVAGLIQYRMGIRHLEGAGELETDRTPEQLRSMETGFFVRFALALAAVVFFGWLVYAGTIPMTIQQVATWLGYGILVLAVGFFVYLWAFGGHTPTENKRLLVIFWLFVLSAIFWSGFEQAGSSLNLFASELTDRNVFGWEMPAAFLQSVNSFFIIILAPLFGSLWVWLSQRNANPSMGAKFGFGLLGLSVGFFVLAWGAANAGPGNLVSPAWLVVTYFFHTVGELALSPVGLSSITKLAPRNRVGQMMGVWFVGVALGNLFAGLVAGSLENLPAADLFRAVAMIVAAAGVIGLAVSPLTRRVTAEVE